MGLPFAADLPSAVFPGAFTCFRARRIPTPSAKQNT